MWFLQKPGFSDHCSKKSVGYSKVFPNTSEGWIKHLEEECTEVKTRSMKLRKIRLAYILVNKIPKKRE